MNTFTRIGAALAGTALTVGVALPAQAATSNTLGSAQQLATARIDGRLETLRALDLAAGSARYIAAADKTALHTVITGDISGLTALRSKVTAETTAAAVHADETTMVDTYRVYLLVVPKVHLTIALDTEAAAAARLQKVHDNLAARLAKKPGGANAGENAELADLQTQIQAAQHAVDGQVVALLALQPGPGGAAITAQVKTIQGRAREARQDLRKAQADAKEIRAAVK